MKKSGQKTKSNEDAIVGDFYRNIECNDDDVISFGEDTFKIGKLKKALACCFGYDIGYALIGLLSNQGVKIDKKVISPQESHEDYQKWFEEGIDCEILKTDAVGWRKAKVKINVKIEFIEEESASENFMEQQMRETDATIHHNVILNDDEP